MPQQSLRKFYKTTFKITVLSEDLPLDSEEGISLRDIECAISHGDCVGDFALDSVEEVSSQEMADLLKELGSSPAFFALTAQGEDDLEEIAGHT